ncbi:hypothetical protein EZS27_027224 [termite gut metagenome]|uniref:HU domain-containing protein n=1 Tax=termite gut metagenome TaxID=433724 RepID=A0A5J4QN59_9ZZZZ
MPVKVQHYLLKEDLKDPSSKPLYHLRQVPGTSQIQDISDIAKTIEKTGALSAEDVEHTMKAFIYELKKTLLRGDKVKVDGLGIFSTTFHSPGKEAEKDSTVKTINRVNIRFRVDNSMRLVNDSTATTRGGENNVVYVLQEPSSGGGGGTFAVTGVSLNDAPVPAGSGELNLTAGDTLKIQGTALSETVIKANFATTPTGSYTDRSLSDLGAVSIAPTLITIQVTIAAALVTKLLKADTGAMVYEFGE